MQNVLRDTAQPQFCKVKKQLSTPGSRHTQNQAVLHPEDVILLMFVNLVP
jgi:hypothetical protein